MPRVSADARMAREPFDGAALDDPRAFARVAHEFTPPLQRLARRYVRSPDVAAEIVQDVFLSLWRSPPMLDGPASLAAYLHRATRNRALDHLARETVRRRGQSVIVLGAELQGTRAHTAPANEVVELAELVATIDAVLDAMPARRRAVCALRWKDGLPVAQIAERLGLTPKTVEVQLGRGRKQLRSRLDR
jgi:RNA polymerase sigma-70 factor (ECF subfamily)